MKVEILAFDLDPAIECEASVATVEDLTEEEAYSLEYFIEDTLGYTAFAYSDFA